MPGRLSRTVSSSGYKKDPHKLACGGPKSSKKYASGGKMKKSKKK